MAHTQWLVRQVRRNKLSDLLCWLPVTVAVCVGIAVTVDIARGRPAFAILPIGMAFGLGSWFAIVYGALNRIELAHICLRYFWWFPALLGVVTFPLWLWVAWQIRKIGEPFFDVGAQVIPV